MSEESAVYVTKTKDVEEKEKFKKMLFDLLENDFEVKKLIQKHVKSFLHGWGFRRPYRG